MQQKALWICVVGASVGSLYCGHLLAQARANGFRGLLRSGLPVLRASAPQDYGRPTDTRQGDGVAGQQRGEAQAAHGQQGEYPRRRRPMLWFHIHKNAGTFMCRLAHKAGERVVKPDDACCNWKPYDAYPCVGKWPQRQISCDRRWQYFDKHNFTWGGIERDLWPSDHCWDQFRYGTLLRSPLDYVRSTLNYYIHFEKMGDRDEILEDLRSRLQQREPRRLAKHPPAPIRSPTRNAAKGAQNKTPGQSRRPKRAKSANPEHQTGVLAGQCRKSGHENQEIWKNLDNYQTRVLAGAFGVPAGGINATHLAAARRELERFVVVAKVEDLQRPGFAEQLMRRVGWTVSEELLGYAAAPVFSSKELHSNRVNFTAAELAWLLEVNSVDLALWSELEST